MNYTQQQLRIDLKQEELGKTKIYYSLVKKDGKTISFITNERLLIYDDTRRILYYINDFKNTPFKSYIPDPKNQMSMPLDTCNFSNPEQTNSLQVRVTGPNSKGELETIEWIFTFETKKLLYAWMDLLSNEKNRMMEEKIGQKGAGFIHDTLLEAVNMKENQNIRQTILKPEEEVINIMIPPKEQSQIRNSRLSDPKKSNIHNTSNVGTQNQRDQQLLYSNAINMYVKPQPEVVPSPNNSNIRGTNSNIQGISNSNIRPPPPPNESRLTNTNIRQNEPNTSYSNIRNTTNNQSRQNESKASADWNFRFLKEPTEATIYQFERAAFDSLKAVWNKDTSNIDENSRVYDIQGVRIIVANCFTKEAIMLKRQFRNYHFILEATKNKTILGVPLCTLIEWQGIVALVKAPLPAQAEEVRLSKVMLEVRQLERYTRVSNGILEKANLWDVTDIYGPNGQHRSIYVDGLFQYLPIHLDDDMLGSSLRPEYLLDTVNQIVPGGDTKGASRQQQKQLATASSGILGCIKDLAEFLNAQDVLWVDAIELKQIFHSYGVNFKFLPRVYDQISSKQVRKYIQSVMAAKVAKDQVYDSLLQARRDDSRINLQQMVGDYLKLLMQGNNTNSSQVWKEITLRFKRQYGQPISNSELIPGFFLNSLVKLLRVQVDMSKFAKSKKVFKEEGVVSPGFVVQFNPKMKSYYRYTTEFVEKIKYASREEKKSRQIYQQIVDHLELTSRPLPEEYTLNNNYQPIYEYLTYYSCPSEFDSNAALRNVPIYEELLKEPPSAFTLRITKSYIEWAIKKERTDQFKKNIQQALKLSDFWLEDGHIYQTDLLQLLSDYYSSQGNYQESINFMKESLSKTIRSCGVQSRRAGNKYYELGERELKAGRKKEALDSFSKAKANMLANKNSTIKYPLLLMRLASLHLNSGDIEGCIEGALDSIKQFDEYDKNSGTPSLTEGYKIKTYQVLARAYEISLKRNQLKEMAMICARKFNTANMEWTYEQMVRICLAAAIFYHSSERCQLFVGLCARLQKEDEGMDANMALKQLMKLSESFVVMEKFLFRFDSLERLAGQSTSKKAMSQDSRDFLMITRRLAAVVGDDYIEGLVQQKQYE